MQEMWVGSLDRKDPLEKKKVADTTVFSPGKSMDREAWQAIVRGVAWGCKRVIHYLAPNNNI